MKKLQLQQLDRQLERIKTLKPYLTPPPGGWARTIRKALGITAQLMAKRLKVSRSRVIQIERHETEGSITLTSLEKVAEVLNCELVYAFIPKTSLKETLYQVAVRLSKEMLSQINHSMSLEDQGLTNEQLETAKKTLIEELLSGSLKKLWENDSNGI